MVIDNKEIPNVHFEFETDEVSPEMAKVILALKSVTYELKWGFEEEEDEDEVRDEK